MSCSCLFVVKLIILGSVRFLVLHLLVVVFSWLRLHLLVVFSLLTLDELRNSCWLSLGLRNSWARLIC